MNKVYSGEKLQKELDRLRKEGKKIIFTNGCFDILHVGHARYLQEAKKLGDILTVAINSDSSVRAIKGERRPLIPENERAEMVASLASVDYVTIFHESTPLGLIEYLQPHVIVKGGDWEEEDVVGRESVKKWGGIVVIVPEIGGASTSGIIEKITKVYGNE
ncbi:MAG: D-glycero-beta-D-manno-heptose 1-phosphate adenylyltransferase [Syntrophales bacterium]|nr:D-glycero-beta-D-manno-heptose 1-phosphate adenylyltransferase [Syntrophales bacterium]